MAIQSLRYGTHVYILYCTSTVGGQAVYEYEPTSWVQYSYRYLYSTSTSKI